MAMHLEAKGGNTSGEFTGGVDEIRVNVAMTVGNRSLPCPF